MTICGWFCGLGCFVFYLLRSGSIKRICNGGVSFATYNVGCLFCIFYIYFESAIKCCCDWGELDRGCWLDWTTDMEIYKYYNCNFISITNNTESQSPGKWNSLFIVCIYLKKFNSSNSNFFIHSQPFNSSRHLFHATGSHSVINAFELRSAQPHTTASNAYEYGDKDSIFRDSKLPKNLRF